VPPTQAGPPFPATGAAGGVLTITPVLAPVEHPLTVAMTLYVPAAAAVTFGTVGFWSADVNPFGPVHAYVAPATGAAVSASVPPGQSGPLLPAVGTGGEGITAPETLEADVWPENVRTTV
jgi:hypothetical protein